MPQWHLTLAARRRKDLFPTEEQQRAGVRCLAELAEGRLSLFSLVNEHGHAVASTLANKLGKLRRRLRDTVSTASEEPIETLWDEQIKDPGHARRLVRYCVTQVLKHNKGVHPALHSGSCIHDLLGTRWLPELELRTELVGNPEEHELLGYAGLDAKMLLPLSDGDIRALGAGRLKAAVTAALAVGPRLTGRSRPVVLARHTIMQMGVAAGISRGELTHILGINPRSVSKMLRIAVPPEAEKAVRLRLCLEQEVARTTGCTFRLGR